MSRILKYASSGGSFSSTIRRSILVITTHTGSDSFAAARSTRCVFNMTPSMASTTTTTPSQIRIPAEISSKVHCPKGSIDHVFFSVIRKNQTRSRLDISPLSCSSFCVCVSRSSKGHVFTCALYQNIQKRSLSVFVRPATQTCRIKSGSSVNTVAYSEHLSSGTFLSRAEKPPLSVCR